MKSKWRQAAFANIKGTPAMKAWKVAADLRKIKANCSVAGVVEFRWPWYWRKAASLLSKRPGKGLKWGSAPTYSDGLSRPVFGAQCMFWKRALWKRLDTMQRRLHKGHAGISEERRLRSVLLTDRESGLSCWFGTTHFVVGGDEKGDGPLRKQILREDDIPNLDDFLADMGKTGFPIIFGLDANIHPKSEAYRLFMEMLNRHGATVLGEHGVEFVFVIQGKTVQVEVGTPHRIPTTELHTDHEVRLLPFRLSSVE